MRDSEIVEDLLSAIPQSSEMMPSRFWRSWVFDVFVLLLLTALFSCGNIICRQEPAEDLVLVINSIAHPTFYYSGSNRIFNLVGYATSWINDADANYRAQMALRMLFAVMWPYLTFRIVLKPPYCLVAALIFHGIVLYQSEWLTTHEYYGSVDPYSTSWFFFAVAVLLIQKLTTERPRPSSGSAIMGFALVFLLALIASALSPINAVFILLVLGSYFAFDSAIAMGSAHPFASGFARLRSVTKRPMSVVGSSILLFSAALIVAAAHGTIYAKMYPEWVRSFSSSNYLKFKLESGGPLLAAKNLFLFNGRFVLLAEVATVLVFVLWASRGRALETMRRTLSPQIIWLFSALSGALIYAALISQMTHMQESGEHPRYFLTVSFAIIFLFVIVVMELFVALFATKTAPRAAAPAITVVAILFALGAGGHAFGTPSASCPPSDTEDMKAGLFAAKGKYFGVLGSYWHVWPTVFNAWKAQTNVPTDKRIFPTGFRAEVFVPNIRDEAIRRLQENGSIKLLCIGKKAPVPDLGGIVGCEKMAEWNKAWGILPDGQYTETENALGDGYADLTITLRK